MIDRHADRPIALKSIEAVLLTNFGKVLTPEERSIYLKHGTFCPSATGTVNGPIPESTPSKQPKPRKKRAAS